MLKDGFNWKSLFINDENQTKATPAETVKTTNTPVDTKFPETNLNTNTSTGSTNPFLNEILQVYDKGFESLNHEGFDFFELYKSVMAVGPTNPQSYQMAFAMGKSLRVDLTKELLLEKSKFYISEIEKVYTKYEETGTSKNKNLNNTITTQKNNLSKNISDLETQIVNLQKELEIKKAEFIKIDIDNKELFTEIQLKIEANAIAKQKIIETINTVVTGVNQYL